MGNVGQCCTSDARPCCSGDVPAPLDAEPLPREEVVGPDGLKANRVDMLGEVTVNEEESALNNTKGNTEGACPGGDSAAGGGGEAADKQQEHQFVTYEDGSTYTGQVVNSKRQGQGLWQSRSGQYEGQWLQDAQHGKGRQTWSDGRIYDGQFAMGRFSGNGRMTWHTQKGLLTYDGQYEDDLKHGSGRFVWADGRSYDGEWVRGKRSGRGLYMNARCEKRVGYWIDDKFDHWEEAAPAGQAEECAGGAAGTGAAK